MANEPNSNGTSDFADQAEYFDKLKNAPIAELAAYLGKDIDAAVALRVEAAKAESVFEKMDISIRPIEPKDKLYGFASVTVGAIKIDDFKIIESKDGELFVGMPSKPDKSSKTGYRNTVFVDKDFKEDFTAAVIGKYNAAVQAHNREGKPERMADQVAKAAKEAEKHNAALPPKEKGAKTREDRE